MKESTKTNVRATDKPRSRILAAMERKKLPVYVVDDDASVRAAIERLLRSSGYTVETFSSAKSFFDSVDISAKGILILDQFLPGVTGFSIQEKLSRMSSPMEIVILTGWSGPGDRQRALSHGAKGFLHKPVDAQELLNAVGAAQGDVCERAAEETQDEKAKLLSSVKATY
jgi:FixJ family two-component response regulator